MVARILYRTHRMRFGLLKRTFPRPRVKERKGKWSIITLNDVFSPDRKVKEGDKLRRLSFYLERREQFINVSSLKLTSSLFMQSIMLKFKTCQLLERCIASLGCIVDFKKVAKPQVGGYAESRFNIVQKLTR